LCLLNEGELLPFIEQLRKDEPAIDIALIPSVGAVEILFTGEKSLDSLVEKVKNKFPTFFLGDEDLLHSLQSAFISKKSSVALAESCTGGAMAAKITSIPDASKYFLGSVVAYSNEWKESFLHVSRTTLEQKGAVSKEAVVEMVKGLLDETNADYAVAISGIAGPGGGTREKPVGTIYVAIGKRGDKIDVGLIQAPGGRNSAIEMAVHLCLGALWRRIVHNAVTFS